MGHCKHPDPDLQIEQHRPARLAHRRAATDRLGANQEPSVAHTAAVELAPTVHHLRHVTVTTTVYLYPSSSGQSLASVMPTRRLPIRHRYVAQISLHGVERGGGARAVAAGPEWPRQKR